MIEDDAEEIKYLHISYKAERDLADKLYEALKMTHPVNTELGGEYCPQCNALKHYRLARGGKKGK